MRELFWSNPKAIDFLEKELHDGRVVLAEGDTVLGLLADVSEKGVVQLDHIKGRSQKPYLILVGDPKKAFNFIEIDPKKVFQVEKLINICWPGPVTLIFKAKNEVSSQAKSAQGNIALRIPDHAGLLQLLSRFDALFSTSANRSGQPVPNGLGQVDSHIKDSVACIVVNDAHERAESDLPSTIIDCTGDKLIVVRKGAFELTRLKSFF